MATRMYLLGGTGVVSDTFIGYGETNLRGTTPVGFHGMPLSTTAGSGVIAGATASTVTGPTPGIEANGTFSFGTDWISLPVAADVTISGTITANIWAAESNMSANVAINVQILVARANDDTGGLNLLEEIVRSTRTTEVAVTTRAVNNFTTGLTAADYVDVAIRRGDRLVIRPFGDDAGTMATGFTFNISYNGATGGADGDTWVEFTETITFETTDPPTGSTIYFTNTASDVSTAAVDREAWTSRGAGVQSDGTIGQNAPHAPRQMRDDFIDVGYNVITTNAEGDLDNSADRAAQSFTATITGEIAMVQLSTRKQGSPTDNVTVELQGDSGGSPDGNVLATATVAASSLAAGGLRNDFTFATPASVTASTVYWIVAYRTGSTDGANFVRCTGVSPSSYAGGAAKNSTNSGGSWNANATLLDLGVGVHYQVSVWFTKQLAAFTLGGMAKANLRLKSNTTSGSGPSARLEIARVDADGSNPVVWATWPIKTNSNDGGSVQTTEEARTVYCSGDDLAIADGQRLRLRVMEEDATLGDNGGQTLTFFYAGTSGGASGDSFVIFPQTLTEYVPPAMVPYRKQATIVNPAVPMNILRVR